MFCVLYLKLSLSLILLLFFSFFSLFFYHWRVSHYFFLYFPYFEFVCLTWNQVPHFLSLVFSLTSLCSVISSSHFFPPLDFRFFYPRFTFGKLLITSFFIDEEWEERSWGDFFLRTQCEFSSFVPSIVVNLDLHFLFSQVFLFFSSFVSLESVSLFPLRRVRVRKCSGVIFVFLGGGRPKNLSFLFFHLFLISLDPPLDVVLEWIRLFTFLTAWN